MALAVAAVVGAGLALAASCVTFGPPSTESAFEGRPAAWQCRGGRREAGARRGNGLEDGPVVLFVHGTPGSWNDFAYVMADPALASRARLLSVDRLGWGASSERIEPSLEAQAAALRSVLEGRSAGMPAIVVGHSLGGPIAARLAMDAPELVGGLLLVAPSIDPELERTTWYQAVARWPWVRPLLPDMLARADDEIRPLHGELERMLPRWSELTLPVTLIQGEDDGLVPPANADFAERVVTHAPLAVERVPDQGHLIPWERPDLIRDALLAMLAHRSATSAAGS
ncbi:MAG: alpha/beta hydrolase [Thermoanaerobaculia bacterium]